MPKASSAASPTAPSEPPVAPASRPAAPAAPETKVAVLRRLMARKTGADLAALQSATGWQAHSVRAALSGLRKAGYVIARTDPAKPGDTAVYRITERPGSGA